MGVSLAFAENSEVPAVVAPPAVPSEGLLMTGLGSIGVGDLLKKAGINFLRLFRSWDDV